MDFCNNIEITQWHIKLIDSAGINCMHTVYSVTVFCMNGMYDLLLANIIEHITRNTVCYNTVWSVCQTCKQCGMYRYFLQDGCSNCVVKAGNAMVILLPEATMQHPVPLESVWVWEKMERRREGRNRSRDWEVKPLWFLEWMKAQTALCGLLRKYRFFTFNIHTQWNG